MTENGLNDTELKPAVFFDRDGVICEMVYHADHGIMDSPFTLDQFRLLPGIAKVIKQVRDAGYLAILVSNQPGIAKGHLSLETFMRIKEKMTMDLAAHGAYLDGQYYCLHHPDAVEERYRVDCNCRKPRPGLLFQAAQEHGIDLAGSWFIGDGVTDVKAGNEAGVKTVLFVRMKCEVCQLLEKYDAKPVLISNDFTEITDIICQPSMVTMLE